MKVYSITIFLRAEDGSDAKSNVTRTYEEAVAYAKKEREIFKKENFEDDDSDYNENDYEGYYSAYSNNCFCEFCATIREHEI